MENDTLELVLLEDQPCITLADLANCSGLSEQDLDQLVDFGIIVPVDLDAVPPVFSPQWIVTSRIAFRLRGAFDLDGAGMAVALILLERIRELEGDLLDMCARSPARMRSPD